MQGLNWIGRLAMVLELGLGWPLGVLPETRSWVLLSVLATECHGLQNRSIISYWALRLPP